jgi:hypothetical protein
MLSSDPFLTKKYGWKGTQIIWKLGEDLLKTTNFLRHSELMIWWRNAEREYLLMLAK